MRICYLSISKLKPYPNNPRRNEKTIAKVAASLKEFGWQQPIVTDKDYTIIVGHTRWLAAKQLGMSEAPVLVAEDLSEQQVLAYRLTDNRLSEESQWDEVLLAKELHDLQKIGGNLVTTAFNEKEIDCLLTNLLNTNDYQDENVVVPKVSVSQKGDLWLLDKHRVLCGDATETEKVRLLMQDNKVALVILDPPYNLDYHGHTKESLTMQNDHMSVCVYQSFLKKLFRNSYLFSLNNAGLYVSHAYKFQREVQNAIEDNHYLIRTQIIWAKNHFTQGRQRYKFQHEPLFYCHKKNYTDAWYGNLKQTTLWTVRKPQANPFHPTMKPIELMKLPIKNSSRIGDKVLDLCGGSGSTLIACEMLKREAYIMEIDPIYVDVIIQRWQQYTGKVAIHSSLQTFNEMAQQRNEKISP